MKLILRLISLAAPGSPRKGSVTGGSKPQTPSHWAKLDVQQTSVVSKPQTSCSVNSCWAHPDDWQTSQSWISRKFQMCLLSKSRYPANLKPPRFQPPSRPPTSSHSVNACWENPDDFQASDTLPLSKGGQIKMEETGCEVIYGAPTTLTVKG